MGKKKRIIVKEQEESQKKKKKHHQWVELHCGDINGRDFVVFDNRTTN